MTTETELQTHHLAQHYNPNETHPAEQVLRDLLAEMRRQIKNANSLPDILGGDLVSVQLAYQEDANLKAQLQAQVRTMRGIEKIIIEQYPGVLNNDL